MTDTNKRSGNKPGRPAAVDITDAQRKTLELIVSMIHEKGISPTSAEIARRLKIARPSAIEQIDHLIRKGYLKKEHRKARSLQVVRLPERDESGEDLIVLPIIGKVAAGVPIEAQEDRIGEIKIKANAARLRKCFAMEVQGDSMIDANINEGDFVIVRPQPVAESGDVVVAMISGDATVKRLFIQDDQIELRPENRKLKPIPIQPWDDFRIIGKVLSVKKPSLLEEYIIKSKAAARRGLREPPMF